MLLEAEDADAEETCAEQVVCEETNRPMHRSDCAQLVPSVVFKFRCQEEKEQTVQRLL